MSSHINSKPSLDLSQANASRDILPTLHFPHCAVSIRFFVHTDGETGESSGQSFLVAIIVIVVAVNDARDGKGEDFLELFAHGLGDFALAFRLSTAVTP